MTSKLRSARGRFHGRRARCAVAVALIAAASAIGAAHAAVGSTTVAGGSLIVNGALDNTAVAVSNGGVIGGNGAIGAGITLTGTGVVSPGADGAVGELDGASLDWQAGGAIAFQLGADSAASDRLALSGALARQGSGTFEFRFGDGAAPPTPGTTYTLMTFASQSGFAASDFSYIYSGSAADLIGQFALDATSLSFTVISTPVELQSFEVD